MKHANPHIDPDALPGRFGLAEDLPALLSDWHQHQRPQLLYASQGALKLQAADRLVVLPPERAAWIPAGLAHRVEASRPVRLRTVYFLACDEVGPQMAVFAAPPLLKEMAIQAAAWGAPAPDWPEVEPFFLAFAALAAVWRQRPLSVELPAARSPELAVALDFLLQRLDRPVGLKEAARAAGLSVRTLQRRCQVELGVPLQAWLHRARIVTALELLADPAASVGEIAVRVGYGSGAAFTRSFAEIMGSPPSGWRGGSGGLIGRV